MNAETKPCRHCGEPILAVARVCRHCKSNQTWSAGQRDPRFQLMVVLVLLPLLAIRSFILRDAESQFERSFSPESSCRGLVKVTTSQHEVRTTEGHEGLFVRVQLTNGSKSDISDPVIKVEALTRAAP